MLANLRSVEVDDCGRESTCDGDEREESEGRFDYAYDDCGVATATVDRYEPIEFDDDELLEEQLKSVNDDIYVVVSDLSDSALEEILAHEDRGRYYVFVAPVFPLGEDEPTHLELLYVIEGLPLDEEREDVDDPSGVECYDRDSMLGFVEDILSDLGRFAMDELSIASKTLLRDFLGMGSELEISTRAEVNEEVPSAVFEVRIPYVATEEWSD